LVFASLIILLVHLSRSSNVLRLILWYGRTFRVGPWEDGTQEFRQEGIVLRRLCHCECWQLLYCYHPMVDFPQNAKYDGDANSDVDTDSDGNTNSEQDTDSDDES
jgi:hypothetical protein